MMDASDNTGAQSKPTPKERYLTKAEVASLIDNASAPHIGLAIHLLFAAAGRVGAILNLTWNRVDMDRAVINLRIPRKGRAIVPINRGLMAALQTAKEPYRTMSWNTVGSESAASTRGSAML